VDAPVSNLVADKVTALNDATVNGAGNATVRFPAARELTNVSLVADSSAAILLPAIQTFGVAGGNLVQANGFGSVIDLSNLTTMAGGGGPIQIEPKAGGEVRLGGSIGTAVITVDAPVSNLVADKVTALNDATVNASGTATVPFPAARELTNVSLVADSGAAILLPAVQTYGVAGGNQVRASGGNSLIDLSNLTTMSGGGGPIQIEPKAGGEVRLGGSIGTAVITVDSAASKLVADKVTSLNDATVNAGGNATVSFPTARELTNVSLVADSGAAILLPAVQTFGVAGDNLVQATGLGSRIDLAVSGTMSGGGGPIQVKALSGGELRLGGTIAHAVITVDAAASKMIPEPAVQFSDTVLLASHGGKLSFASDSDVAFGPGVMMKLADAQSSLVIDPAAKLDVLRSAVVIDYVSSSPLGAWMPGGYTGIQGLIGAARNGGLWNGKGIGSRFAGGDDRTVAAGEASQVLGLSGGQTGSWQGFTVDATSVLLTYTIGGDANLDGVVDFADLVILAQQYNTSGKTFVEGNFNYDAAGDVDFADLVIMAQHYNTSLAAAAQPTLLTRETPARPAKSVAKTPPRPVRKASPQPPFSSTAGNRLRRA
ncbi:MAG TPA: hypothetical protein VH475_08710, partial [Tepidisphaeraceae bacterium]